MGTLFRENNIDADRINYFTKPFTLDALRSLIAKTGLAPFAVLRKNEIRDSGLTPDSSLEDVVAAVIANPNLLQRPIVEVGDRAVLARPIEKALDLVAA